MIKGFMLGVVLLPLGASFAVDTNLLNSWVRNTTGETGYDGIETNVQVVQYDDDYVYVSSTGIPDYEIGPWDRNPNTPTNQNSVTRFPKSASKSSVVKYTGLGAIGMWKNGVAIFNPKDGQYWNNSSQNFSNGVTTSGWNRNALYFEGISFDACLGHPNGKGAYHHHVSPNCLYDITDSSNHSPIIGYAFDGYPIYGGYGFTNTNGTGSVKRMESSFVLSMATSRIDGSPVNSNYPLSSMCEDYIYTQGVGDLDEHNGRFSVTPEYPEGTYAYFTTLTETLSPAFPFVVGPTFYGTLAPGSEGPNNTAQTIPGNTVVYTDGITSVKVVSVQSEVSVDMGESGEFLFLTLSNESVNNLKATLYDSRGVVVQSLNNMHPSLSYFMPIGDIASGNYSLVLQSESERWVKSIHKP
ncbi:YHYH protein [Fibrobacterales bacterium]|nr:YHYH protein [Fibrobacterales bacterium]